MVDFRDTQYWNRFTVEEKANYIYLVETCSQAGSYVEFAISGKYQVDSKGLVDLMNIYLRASTAVFEYEKTLLVKYWRTNVPGSSTTQ